MREPFLVIMAAGMGSRFGGLKQITPVDDQGHKIIDFSLYDAYRAGFRKVVFIIKHEIEEDFKAAIGTRIGNYLDVRYVFQELDVLPEGFTVPEGRKKPWGTAHAIACIAGVVDEPFAILNADDYYGPTALKTAYDFLSQERKSTEHCMVGYKLRNTVTENGYVSRGVCEGENGFLKSVTERTHIEKRGSDAAYTENGTDYMPLSGDTLVSMNMWGFQPEVLKDFVGRFPVFLEKELPKNPLKCEYFLPSIVSYEIENGSTVEILDTDDVWHGVTYVEDLPDLKAAIRKLKDEGTYPEILWE